MRRKLRLILSELQQMIVNFSYCYENHIEPWCDRTQPPLSKLGHKITSIQRMLHHFTTVIYTKSTLNPHPVPTPPHPTQIDKLLDRLILYNCLESLTDIKHPFFTSQVGRYYYFLIIYNNFNPFKEIMKWSDCRMGLVKVDCR